MNCTGKLELYLCGSKITKEKFLRGILTDQTFSLLFNDYEFESSQGHWRLK